MENTNFDEELINKYIDLKLAYVKLNDKYCELLQLENENKLRTLFQEKEQRFNNACANAWKKNFIGYHSYTFYDTPCIIDENTTFEYWYSTLKVNKYRLDDMPMTDELSNNEMLYFFKKELKEKFEELKEQALNKDKTPAKEETEKLPF